jgi:hypothetical protein
LIQHIVDTFKSMRQKLANQASKSKINEHCRQSSNNELHHYNAVRSRSAGVKTRRDRMPRLHLDSLSVIIHADDRQRGSLRSNASRLDPEPRTAPRQDYETQPFIAALPACCRPLAGGGEDRVRPQRIRALGDIDLEVAAKLDTGAKTASLSARDIKRFKRNGESWVRFYLAIDAAHSHPIERPWPASARSSAAPATTTR